MFERIHAIGYGAWRKVSRVRGSMLATWVDTGRGCTNRFKQARVGATQEERRWMHLEDASICGCDDVYGLKERRTDVA